MTPSPTITTLFLDVGQVLLTDSWGPTMRQRAVDAFGFDFAEVAKRSQLTFEGYFVEFLSFRVSYCICRRPGFRCTRYRSVAHRKRSSMIRLFVESHFSLKCGIGGELRG